MLDLARKAFAPNVLSGMTEGDLERWMAKRLERPEFSNEKPLNYRRSDPYVPPQPSPWTARSASPASFHVAVTSLFAPGRSTAQGGDDVVFTAAGHHVRAAGA